jgi:hypothetical protein
VLEMAEDDVSSPIRKTTTGGFTTEKDQANHLLLARVTGMVSFISNRSSQSSRASPSSDADNQYTIIYVLDLDDEDMVDAVNMVQATVGRDFPCFEDCIMRRLPWPWIK